MSEPLPFRAIFAHTDFLRFWFARFAGLLANQMLMVALAWHMYDLTGSAWDLGLVGLFQFLPALLLTLPAGHLADRLRRGRIFASCMLIQSLAAAVIVAATASGSISRDWLLGLSVLLGMTRAFQMPAQQAMVPLLVPPPLLERAFTLAAGSMQAALIAGPALGGLLYVFGPQAVYLTSAFSLAVAAVVSRFVRHRHAPSQEPTTLRTVLAGVVFMWRHKLLLGATSLDLFAVLLGGATALLPIYARDILHTGPEGLGLLRAAPAAGALIISGVLLRWPIRRRVGRALLVSVAVFGLSMVVFGVSTSFWLSAAALAVSGAADNISVVLRQTLIQLETPNDIRGRVSAVNSIFIGASNQLGEFESGALAAWLGPVAAVVLGGAGAVAIAAAWTRLFPSLRQRDRLSREAG